MLRRASILLAAIPVGLAYSQQPAPSAPIAVPGQGVQPGAPDKLSAADLEELLAPIALYPDPLLANILAASVYPDEVAAAAKMSGADAATINSQSWEAAVKAVASVPDAIKMMGQYPDWTRALGQAYIVQSQDVMAAIQTLRARAQANGALKTSQQQTVTSQGDTIIIQPAQPDVIYVPTYNPSVVYVNSGSSSSDAAAAGIIGFGVGVAVGAIIANNVDCDWHGGCIGWGHNDVDIDVNRNVNINNTNINNNINRTNVGKEGGRWEPNAAKSSVRPGSGYDRATLNNYKGVGEGTRQSSIPNRQANAKPIASRPAPTAAERSAGAERARSNPSNRAASVPDRPAATPVNRPAPANKPAAKPSTPASRPSAPASRPSNASGGGASMPASRPSSPSVYGGGSGGSNRAAASRGAASRGGGGGGGRGGGRR